MPIPRTTAPKDGDTLAISLMKICMLLGGTPALGDNANRSAQKINAALAAGGVVTVGTIVPYAGETAPRGTLLCDGASYPRADYPALSAVLGTRWGGDANSFNVPDLRGRAPVGAGLGSGLTNRVLAARGGEEAHVLTVGELASHNHAFAMSPRTGALTANAGSPEAGDTSVTADLGSNPTNLSGSSFAHNNMQPFLAVNYLIMT